jgi:hypothetical protein
LVWGKSGEETETERNYYLIWAERKRESFKNIGYCVRVTDIGEREIYRPEDIFSRTEENTVGLTNTDPSL